MNWWSENPQKRHLKAWWLTESRLHFERRSKPNSTIHLIDQGWFKPLGNFILLIEDCLIYTVSGPSWSRGKLNAVEGNISLAQNKLEDYWHALKTEGPHKSTYI